MPTTQAYGIAGSKRNQLEPKRDQAEVKFKMQTFKYHNSSNYAFVRLPAIRRTIRFLRETHKHAHTNISSRSKIPRSGLIIMLVRPDLRVTNE